MLALQTQHHTHFDAALNIARQPDPAHAAAVLPETCADSRCPWTRARLLGRVQARQQNCKCLQRHEHRSHVVVVLSFTPLRCSPLLPESACSTGACLQIVSRGYRQAHMPYSSLKLASRSGLPHLRMTWHIHTLVCSLMQ